MTKYTEDLRKSVTLNKKLLKAEVERRFTVISDPILPTPSFNALSVLGLHVELPPGGGIFHLKQIDEVFG